MAASAADAIVGGGDVFHWPDVRGFGYDLARAAEHIRGTDYPMADDFAARHVLDPPSGQTMLEMFGPAELEG